MWHYLDNTTVVTVWGLPGPTGIPRYLIALIHHVQPMGCTCKHLEYFTHWKLPKPKVEVVYVQRIWESTFMPFQQLLHSLQLPLHQFQLLLGSGLKPMGVFQTGLLSGCLYPL